MLYISFIEAVPDGLERECLIEAAEKQEAETALCEILDVAEARITFIDSLDDCSRYDAIISLTDRGHYQSFYAFAKWLKVATPRCPFCKSVKLTPCGRGGKRCCDCGKAFGAD